MNTSLSTFVAILAGFGLSSVLTGCSSGSGEVQRYEIEGTVVLDGKALSTGTIFLQPDSEQGNSGPGSSGEIVDGKFAIPVARGVVGGPYLALISGKMTGESLNKQQVMAFDDYSTKIALPQGKSVQNFEVNSSEIPKSKLQTATVKGE